ncbi:hypothetical protein Snas_5885 [Stackebrandtia nassauensis DSM 44728]|uniref:Uncharacterized protein n=1 Tax=Stackebrandtia nassauensis (strain DSM 44728 / CIP 108903 / NRRL B-16338 / NBRC 102104 / LLR-40K-21) TaxID=446470 RepID=D3PZ84_STANL|nr:hypothetical protein Snas_5885 [Stackebrandtia nassauensis DSM 44728]
METLCHRYAFGDVRELLPMLRLPESELNRLRRICLFGQRLLDLDAEDFDMADAEAGGPEYTALVDRARACRMPQEPREVNRGALSSLRPAYDLLLEVVRARHLRNEMASLVATVHIIAEYLPLLVWEAVWGHAADPMRIDDNVDGADSVFGQQDVTCGHNRTDKGATARILRIDKAPGQGWRTYLDRQHSNVAHALGVCAAECRDKCSVVTRLPAAVQGQLAERCVVALAFGDSGVIKLRHAAPVGHGFGVPSVEELDETWQHTREVLGKRGGLAESILADDGFCLPGLPSLLTALAGTAIVPDTLLRDTAALTVTKLHNATVHLREAA